MQTIFSIVIWIYWTVCIIAFFCIVSILYLFTFPFDRFNRIPNRILKGLAWIMLKINPGWSFDIEGADPKKIDKPTIVVANHQSFLDLPLLYLLPWRMKWVAKRALFRIPIFGWIIYMTGQIGIDRQSMRSAQKLDELVRPIQEGIPVMIFPEGTRTESGKVKPFKNGAFKLAKRYNCKVLPVILQGAYQAMPSGSWRVAPKQHFSLSVLNPLKPEEFESENELKEAVYLLIKNEVESREC
jgi:1-acyl-sn-glycerol-3-phosphate acyltransferase